MYHQNELLHRDNQYDHLDHRFSLHVLNEEKRNQLSIENDVVFFEPSTINRQVNPMVFSFSTRFDNLSRKTDRLKQLTGNGGTLNSDGTFP